MEQITSTAADWASVRSARRVEKRCRGGSSRNVTLVAAFGHVLNSASVIQALLRADLVDDLRFAIVPHIIGGGLRLLPDGLPPCRWDLVSSATPVRQVDAVARALACVRHSDD